MTFDLLRDASTNERKEIDLKFAKCASPQETGWYSIIQNRGGGEGGGGVNGPEGMPLYINGDRCYCINLLFTMSESDCLMIMNVLSL